MDTKKKIAIVAALLALVAVGIWMGVGKPVPHNWYNDGSAQGSN